MIVCRLLQRAEADALMSSTETMMKFGFMSMSMTYFSSLNMIKAMKQVGTANALFANPLVTAAMQQQAVRVFTSSPVSCSLSPSAGRLCTVCRIPVNACTVPLRAMQPPPPPQVSYFGGAVPAASPASTAVVAAQARAVADQRLGREGPERLEVAQWTVADVLQWLDSIALSQYRHVFSEAAVDGEFLFDLDDQVRVPFIMPFPVSFLVLFLLHNVERGAACCAMSWFHVVYALPGLDQDLRNTLGIEHGLHRKKILNSIIRLRERVSGSWMSCRSLPTASLPVVSPTVCLTRVLPCPAALCRCSRALQSELLRVGTAPHVDMVEYRPATTALTPPRTAPIGLGSGPPGPPRPPPGLPLQRGVTPGPPLGMPVPPGVLRPGTSPHVLDAITPAGPNLEELMSCIRHGRSKQLMTSLALLPDCAFDTRDIQAAFVPSYGTQYVPEVTRQVFHINSTDK